jgi:hypothetical protein
LRDYLEFLDNYASETVEIDRADVANIDVDELERQSGRRTKTEQVVKFVPQTFTAHYVNRLIFYPREG